MNYSIFPNTAEYGEYVTGAAYHHRGRPRRKMKRVLLDIQVRAASTRDWMLRETKVNQTSFQGDPAPSLPSTRSSRVRRQVCVT